MLGKRIKVLLLATVIVTAPLQAQENLSQQGIAAFESGDYQQALEHFRQAEARGNVSESVQYNIAVSLYRLQRYQESEQQFLVLRELPRWNVLATYNLGLIKQAEGELVQAKDFYTLAANQSEYDKIQAMAQIKLNEINSASNTTAAPVRDVQIDTNAQKDWALLSKLSFGNNTNATSLAEELVDESTNVEDEFAELLLYGHKYVTGKYRNGLRVYGLAFQRSYTEFQYLDSTVIGFGAVWEKRFGSVQTELGVRATQTQLDGERVAGQVQINLGASKSFRFGTLGIDYAMSEFNADDRFKQIEGSQERVDLSWTKRFDRMDLSLRLRHETNDRADLQRGAAYASYSPVRDSVKLEAKRKIGSKLNVAVNYEYIDSEYDGINYLRDSDGQIKQVQRMNERARIGVSASYQISKRWKASLDYKHTNVDDSYKLYSYDQDVVSAGIEVQL